MAGLNTKSMLISIGAAGAAMAVLSSIPFVSCVNYLLCAWMWSGGIGAVWLYRQQEIHRNNIPPTIDSIQGILLGAFAGGVAAVLSSILAMAFNIGSLSVLSPMSPINSAVLPWQAAALATFTSFVTGAANLVFGAVGGYLAAQFIFKPKTTAPPTA